MSALPADQDGVVEQATLTIALEHQDEFEAALGRGLLVLEQAAGFRWARLLHQIEDAEAYVLLVGWDSVECHVDGFVKSELFAAWRAEITPYLAGRPAVAHYALGPSIG